MSAGSYLLWGLIHTFITSKESMEQAYVIIDWSEA